MATNYDPRQPQTIVSTTFPVGTPTPAPVQGGSFPSAPAEPRDAWGFTQSELRQIAAQHYPYHNYGEAVSLIHEERRISGMLDRVRREGW